MKKQKMGWLAKLVVVSVATVLGMSMVGCGTTRGNYEEGERPAKVTLSGDVPADGQVIQVIKFDSCTPEVGPSTYLMIWKPYLGEFGDVRVAKCNECFWGDKKSSPQNLYVAERIRGRNYLWVRPIAIE